MGERVSPGAAAKRLGVGGGGIGRAGYVKVAAARRDAWGHEPAVWLGTAQARERRPAGKAVGRAGARRIEVSCCVCGAVLRVRAAFLTALREPES